MGIGHVGTLNLQQFHQFPYESNHLNEVLRSHESRLSSELAEKKAAQNVDRSSPPLS